MEGRWERRARKLEKRRKAMKASGMALKRVLLPLIEKRAEEARHAAPKKRRLRRSRATSIPASSRNRRREFRGGTWNQL